jgi:hypothetical protein
VTPNFRYILSDRDGQRGGRVETTRLAWAAGDTLEADDATWRIVEMLPEVSTAVEYLGVWIVEPA